MFFSGFDFFFNGIFPIMFILIFATAFVMILTTIFSGIKTWNRNNHSPRLTVPAKVVSKRMDVSHHHHHHHDDHAGMHTHTSTSYYVTFEVESGDRMEFYVPSAEFGYMIEGDQGQLSFQGTRFLGFERI